MLVHTAVLYDPHFLLQTLLQHSPYCQDKLKKAVKVAFWLMTHPFGQSSPSYSYTTVHGAFIEG